MVVFLQVSLAGSENCVWKCQEYAWKGRCRVARVFQDHVYIEEATGTKLAGVMEIKTGLGRKGRILQMIYRASEKLT